MTTPQMSSDEFNAEYMNNPVPRRPPECQICGVQEPVSSDMRWRSGELMVIAGLMAPDITRLQLESFPPRHRAYVCGGCYFERTPDYKGRQLRRTRGRGRRIGYRP